MEPSSSDDLKNVGEYEYSFKNNVCLDRNSHELLRSLLVGFYSNKDNLKRVYDIVINNKDNKDIRKIHHERGNKTISIRLIEWFVTTYAPNNEIYINDLNVYEQYNRVLKGYSKKLFDPFCRNDLSCKRVRFFLHMDTLEYCDESDFQRIIQDNPSFIYSGFFTTVAQLKFFAWVISSGILDFILDNKEFLIRELSLDKKSVDETSVTTDSISIASMTSSQKSRSRKKKHKIKTKYRLGNRRLFVSFSNTN